MRTEIETSDLFRGAFLLCCGGRLDEAQVRRDGQVEFVISGEEIHEEDYRYRTGQASVNPLQLRETLNLLRDIVFERVRSERGEGRTRTGKIVFFPWEEGLAGKLVRVKVERSTHLSLFGRQVESFSENQF